MVLENTQCKSPSTDMSVSPVCCTPEIQYCETGVSHHTTKGTVNLSASYLLSRQKGPTLKLNGPASLVSWGMREEAPLIGPSLTLKNSASNSARVP